MKQRDVYNLQEHLQTLTEYANESRRQMSRFVHELERELAHTTNAERAATIENQIAACSPISSPLIGCSCDHHARIGNYFDQSGAVTYHVELAGGIKNVYPLYHQYLPEGEFDLQSVECEPLITSPVRASLERLLQAEVPDARIVWEDPSRHNIRYS